MVARFPNICNNCTHSHRFPADSRYPRPHADLYIFQMDTDSKSSIHMEMSSCYAQGLEVVTKVSVEVD